MSQIEPATYVVSCFKQTSRRLPELSKTVNLCPNELPWKNKIKLIFIIYKSEGNVPPSLQKKRQHRENKNKSGTSLALQIPQPMIFDLNDMPAISDTFSLPLL